MQSCCVGPSPWYCTQPPCHTVHVIHLMLCCCRCLLWSSTGPHDDRPEEVHAKLLPWLAKLDGVDKCIESPAAAMTL